MAKENPTCPVCESPLTTDALRAGKCQCCGSQLPKEMVEQAGKSS
ncbi:MAG: hypothetical protein KatS3mg050_2626 [Litorilinea sp.]|nr:MAG: hypothetical protein KatS3mg050_2626 [Litorilinea sp.]